jgi:DNA mismatch endonuclease (patch repair protein)
VVDKFTKAKRSQIMSKIRGVDTNPERLVRSILHKMGYRFRLYNRQLPGNPDIVLSRHHKVVFIHGCFWHGHKGCRRAKRPSTNVRFWNKKIDSNMKRDQSVKQKLRRRGWRVLIVWQCHTRDKQALERRLERFMSNNGKTAE